MWIIKVVLLATSIQFAPLTSREPPPVIWPSERVCNLAIRLLYSDRRDLVCIQVG